jgi:hypothetical protein
MQNGDVGSCSGSLIAPSLILTAAHCVKNAYPNGWNVYTNIRDNHPVENGTRRQVSDFHVHPLFKLHGNQAFDMAIVQTDSPFKDDNAFTRFPRPRENNARLEQLGICQLTGDLFYIDPIFSVRFLLFYRIRTDFGRRWEYLCCQQNSPPHNRNHHRISVL